MRIKKIKANPKPSATPTSIFTNYFQALQEEDTPQAHDRIPDETSQISTTAQSYPDIQTAPLSQTAPKPAAGSSDSSPVPQLPQHKTPRKGAQGSNTTKNKRGNTKSQNSTPAKTDSSQKGKTVAEPKQRTLQAFYSLSQQTNPSTTRHEGHSTTNVPPARVIQQATPHRQTPAWGPQVTERDIQQASPHSQSQSVTNSEDINPTHPSDRSTTINRSLSLAEPIHNSSRLTHSRDQDVNAQQSQTKLPSILSAPTQQCQCKVPEPTINESERDIRRATLHSQSPTDTAMDQLDPTDHMDMTSTTWPQLINPTDAIQAASTIRELEPRETHAKTPIQSNERDIPQAPQHSQPSLVTTALKHPHQYPTIPQRQSNPTEARHSSIAAQSIPTITNKQNTLHRTPITKDTQKKTKTKNKKKEGKAEPPPPPPPPPLPAEVSDEDIYTFLDIHVPATAYAPIMTADIKVGFLNINALYGVTKMPYVHWLMRMAKLDVVALIDVRSTDASIPYLLANIRKELGPGSRVKSTYGPPGHEEQVRRRHRQSHNSRVGGQIYIMSPTWGRFCSTTWADPSGLGLVSGAEFCPCDSARTLIISTYWPGPPTAANAGEGSLWKQWIQWARASGIHGSPVDWVKRYIGSKITNFKHRYPYGTVICGGDFNATVGTGAGGANGNIERWVDEVKLSSAIHDVSTEERFTRWAGARGTGWIDHILYSKESPTTSLVGACILDQSVWAGISDHRWVIAGFSFPDSIPQQPIPKRTMPLPPDVDLTDKKRVVKYQQRLSQVVSSIKNHEASERLLQICLASQRTAKEIFGRRTPAQKHFNGWSPQLVTLKAQAACLLEIRRCLTGEKGHPRWRGDRITVGIMEEVTKWEKISKKLKWVDTNQRQTCIDSTPTCSPTALRLMHSIIAHPIDH